MRTDYNEKYKVMEQNIEPSDNMVPKRIVVHDGTAHADDIMAVWLMKQINPDITIVRTRNTEDLKRYLQDSYTIVADVGEGIYDHHQINGRYYSDDPNVQMAACGLVWEQWHDKIIDAWKENGVITKTCNNEDVTKEFRDFVLKPIEIKDTSAGRLDVPHKYIILDTLKDIPTKEEESTVSNYVRSNNSVWTPNKAPISDNLTFAKCLAEFDNIVNDFVHEKKQHVFYPVVEAFSRRNEDLLMKIKDNYQVQAEDKKELDNYILDKVHKANKDLEVLKVDTEYTDMQLFKDTNIKLIICPNRALNEVQVRTTSSDIKLRADEFKIDNIFVHPQGHMIAIKTTDDRNYEECSELAEQICNEEIETMHEQENEIDFEFDFDEVF